MAATSILRSSRISHEGLGPRPAPVKRVARWARRLVRVGAVLAVCYALAGYLTARIGPAPASILAPAAGPMPGQPLQGTLDATLADATRGPVASWLAGRGVEVRGAISVHSGRSGDAEGTLDEIGAAADDAGLDFVVLGDHPGIWLDQPGALDPLFNRDVLIVPGQEMVLEGIGRTLTVGLEADTLVRRWEGDAASLAARVDAVGGFVSVVHARSPRGRERWQAGLEAPGIDAWESLDVSEIARLRLVDRWAPYHITSFLVGLATGTAERPVLRLYRDGARAPGLLAYDSARMVQPLTLTAGLNHHPKARIAGRLVPAYGPFFRTLTNHVLLSAPLADDPAIARAQLLSGLRRGGVFVSLGHAAEAEGFRFGVLPTDDGSQVAMGALIVQLPPHAADDLLLRVLHDGQEVGWVDARGGQVQLLRVSAPGVYRVEVYRAGVPLGSRRFDLRLWILSNAVELS